MTNKQQSPQSSQASDVRLLHEALEGARRQLGEAIRKKASASSLHPTSTGIEQNVLHSLIHYLMMVLYHGQETEWEALHARYEVELTDLKGALQDKQAALDSAMLQLADARREGQQSVSERDELRSRVSITTDALQGQVRPVGGCHERFGVYVRKCRGGQWPQ